MSFFDRHYKVFLLLGAPGSPPLWELPQWENLAQQLQELVSSPRGKAAVRSTQYDAAGKRLSFGRLGWDEKSQQKWALPDGKTGQTGQAGRRFVHAEAWAPSWTICERENLAPDFFFSMVNECLLLARDTPLRFNQRILCALATDCGPEKIQALRTILHALAANLQAPVFAQQTRPWGLPWGSGFSDALQDILSTSLFKTGQPHELALDQAAFIENWEFIAV